MLPQASSAVIPSLVGQATGLFDFFDIGRKVIPSQPDALPYAGGVLLEVSLFMVAVYWCFSYRMSMASRQLAKELVVGER